MSLLDVILGGSQAAATMPNGNQYDYDADGNLIPKARPGALVAQAAQAAPAAPSNQAPIDVVGKAPVDTWRPKKAGLLGQIADYLFDTHFGRENVRRNMQGALEHLTSNPTEAIKRLNQVDPTAATELWDKVRDNQRADDAQARMNKAADLGIDKYIDQFIAGVLNRATQSDNPTAMWPKAVARAREIASRYGKEVNLPDIYDPMDADLNSMGVIPPAKQITLKQGQQRLDDNKDYREKNLAERTKYHDGSLQQGWARVANQAQSIRNQDKHATNRENIQRTQNDKQPGKQGSVVMVKGERSGESYPMLVNPDKTQGIMTRGGKKYLYYNVNGNFVFQGEIKPKGSN